MTTASQSSGNEAIDRLRGMQRYASDALVNFDERCSFVDYALSTNPEAHELIGKKLWVIASSMFASLIKPPHDLVDDMTDVHFSGILKGYAYRADPNVPVESCMLLFVANIAASQIATVANGTLRLEVPVLAIESCLVVE